MQRARPSRYVGAIPVRRADVQAEDGSTPQPEGSNGQAAEEDTTEAKAATAEPAPETTFDSARMQEMLNPATMQIYLTQVSNDNGTGTFLTGR